MNISEITPDLILAEMLKEKVVINVSATKTHTLPIYGIGEQPNKGLADEFIAIGINGNIASRTEPIGLCFGYIAMVIFCKSNSDNTIKKNRIGAIIDKCQALISRKAHKGFFFEFDRTNIITPTTNRIADGYSVTILNIKWHS